MSSPARRKQLQAERKAEREAEDQARIVENARKELLTMWLRIDEADTTSDVKDILHRIAEHVGLE